MPAKRIIRRTYGKLEVFEKSVIYGTTCMFVQQNPEHIPDLIHKLDAMLESAYSRGKEAEREKIRDLRQKYLEAIG